LKKISLVLSLHAVLLLLLMLVSCKREEEIGFEVQPSEDKIIVGFNDNSGILSYTIREDSVRTDETLLNLLGSSADPVFGTTTAGFYVQFRLPDNNVSFGTNPVVDSIVLTLAYSGGYYGDITTTQSVNVFEINETFSLDSSYYSNRRLACSNTNLCGDFFVPKPTDSVEFGNQTYVPHLRLTLDNALAQKFLDASGTSNLADNPNFLLYFKGLYIVADPADINGAMLYFNLLSAQSKMTLYYHNDANDSLSYNFVINDNSARINTFEHYGFSGANHDFQMQLAGDTSRGEQTLYLQAMAGTKTYLRFNNLKALLFDGNVVINKAELIITPNASLQGDYTKPAQLTLVMLMNDGTLRFLPDEYYGAAYFGGAYNATTGQYRFNIATYVQYLMKYEDLTGKGLYLAISGASTNGSRLVFNGPGNASSNLSLEITYTKL
jgi:hypothetical protein